jgi:hypothetical protein
MKYDGAVIRMNKRKDELFLFLLDPDTNELKDGINISEHAAYKDMNNSQIMVVEVLFKDGTEEIEKVDLDEFIYGDSYGKYNTFIFIQDKTLFSIGEGIKEDLDPELVSLEVIAEKGDLGNIVRECIEKSKNQIKENE